MKVYRISKCTYINDLSGTGAFLWGGRWNSKGTYMLYTAETASLALLETVVHLTTTASTGFCMICLDIPDSPIQELTIENLPRDWATNPPPDALRTIGNDFISKHKYLALKIPSAVMAEDHNLLINPLHQDARKIKVMYTRELPVDARLVNH